ncbi:DUF642 domain-containing protein, partial [Rubripirellula amarantea]|nr:DUF642 domain-containing protein [Rubripirellula amarantea]
RVTDVNSNTYDEVFTVSLNDLVESNSPPSDLSSGIELNTDGGNDSYLYITDGRPVLGGLTELTLEASFQIDSVPSGLIPIIDYQEGGIATEFGVAINPDGTMVISVADVSHSTSGMYSQLLDGERHQVAVAWDNTLGDVQFFIDGEYVESISGVGTGVTLHNASVTQLVLGQNPDDGSDFYSDEVFIGTFYDVRVWNEVRSEGEISLNYQNKFDSGSLPTGLVANWQMDGFNGASEVVDVVSGNNLSVGHATGAGFTASTPVEDLHIAENAIDGTTVGFVVPNDPDVSNDVASDGLFLEASPPSGGSTTLSASSSFGDWTVGDATGVVLFNGDNAQTPPSGGHVLSLNNAYASISQTLTTEAGKQYQIVFDHAGGFGDGVVDHATTRVSAAGQSQDFTVEKPSGWNFSTNLGWETRSMTFTASDTSTELIFQTTNETLKDSGMIAGIRVIEIPAAVTSILNKDPTLSYDAATNKFYRFVNTNDDFNTQLAAATSASLNGVSGGLVRIDSQYENDMIRQFAFDSGNDIWLGASDANNDGNWNWLDGTAESDDQFWTGGAGGSAASGFYAPAFGQSESAGEDYVRMNTDGTWADDTAGSNNAFVVEWDANEVLSNFTFSLTDDADGRFEIAASTGEITVATGAILDYEIAASHDIRVQVTDAAGNSYTETMTIAVDDQSDIFHDLTDGNDDGIITGTGGGNTIYGGNADGVADGGAVVNDTINAGSGNDEIYGGDGDDVINADDTTVADMLAADPSLVYNESTGKFYKLISGTTDWDSAKEAAESFSVLGQSGRLVQIGTAAENAYVQSLAGGATIWLGASDTGHQDAFVWNDGTPISYENFVSGDPNGAQNEDALILNADGTWSDASEVLSYAYVIEILPEHMDDVITGGSGDDVIEGGIGRDVAVFTGQASDYTITDNMDGTWTVTDSNTPRDGSDTLSGVEQFRFSDQTYETASSSFNSAPTDIELVTPGDDLIAQPIENLQTYTGYSSIYSSVVPKADGGYVLLYTNYDYNSGYDIMAQHYDDDGVAVGEPDIMSRQILTYSDLEFDVATLEDGTHVVTWYDNAYEIRAQRFDADFNELDDAFTVNTTGTYYQYYPDVASTGDGGFVITWRSQVDEDSDGYADFSDVFAQKYDSTGTAVGAEIHATTQTSHQYQTAVAGFADGSFLLTWRSDNTADDGSGSAIMGRFYNTDGTANGAEFLVNTTTSGT